MVQKVVMIPNVMAIAILISVSVSLFNFAVLSDTNRMIFAQKASINKATAEEKVSFLTDDKVLIVGTYYSPSASNKNTSTDAIILLHMLGHDRNDWNTFASALRNSSNGYAVLSIDLRGHGESVHQNGKVISYQSFTPNDFNKMVLDVKAAKQFLVTQKHINPNNIAIVGASIGANVALRYDASDQSIKTVILLSPGLNYRGVITTDLIKTYLNPIYIATAGKDPIAGNDPQTLCNEINCGNKLKVYQASSSHGTDMFLDKSLNPPLDNLIILWLDAAFGKAPQSNS